MIPMILAFASRRPALGLVVVTIIAGLLFGGIGTAYGYFKGRADGTKIAEATCVEEKKEAAKQNLKIREKQDEIRNIGVTPVQLIDRLQHGKF